ncbi:hypothetical protein NLG97_g8884 [Lecanicillium saksenae]|uniref:Uncharacterized protein n=1 Tax=Lecanicillium saksenae TaxID=468837 RepID=A0ACC1QJL3_9HYPO|nr:hypothetical protein NLG97_g8884 [Lecanicillium saksenae]
MSSVEAAMARSLRPTAWEAVTEVLARNLVAQAYKRDIVTDAQGKVTDVKTAFSSWDNCMKAAYCKWPVIAIIVIGSLIILSVICASSVVATAAAAAILPVDADTSTSTSHIFRRIMATSNKPPCSHLSTHLLSITTRHRTGRAPAPKRS